MTHFPFAPSTYMQRRDAFIQLVGSGTYLFLGNHEVAFNYEDNTYPFRQDSTFLYFFGVNLPNVFAVIDADKNECILFADDIDINMLIWTGPQPLVRELAEMAGIVKVLPTADLPKYISNRTAYLPPYRNKHLLLLREWLGLPVAAIKSGPSDKMIEAVIQLRSVKSDDELALMNEAVDISEELHYAVLRSLKPGKYEYEMVAVAESAVRNFNARFAYPAIATINGQVLHNHEYHHKMKDGQLFLLDAGAEHISCYSGDLTRTFPVNGKFSNQQKEIYDIVLDAQNAVVEVLKEGVYYRDMHLLSATVIFEGLKDLGLTKGNTAEGVMAGAHALFFPHGLGHMIGMDVHDMENLGENKVGYGDGVTRSTEFGFRSLRLGKKLKTGNVLTVEPGIYFIPALIDLWKSQGKHVDFINYDALEAYRSFGGIRIEDNYVIENWQSTRIGYNKLVNFAKDIEAAMAG